MSDDFTPSIMLKGLNEVYFKIKRTTELKKLMIAYCERQSVDFNSIDFFFLDRCLQPEHTPRELRMLDGDEIEAMLKPTGGAMLA